MFASTKSNKKGGWQQIKSELQLQEMLAMYNYETSGVDSQIIIGSKDDIDNILRDLNLQRETFTAVGKLKKETRAKILEVLEKKYKVTVAIFCGR